MITFLFGVLAGVLLVALLFRRTHLHVHIAMTTPEIETSEEQEGGTP